MRVLITDGGYKHTLGILQHLPPTYHKTVLSHGKKWTTLCFYSKYCDSVVSMPLSSIKEENKNKLIEILKDSKYDVLIPVGFNSCKLIYEYSPEIAKYTKILSPSWDSFVTASEKEKTMIFSEEVGVPIPKTVPVTSVDDLDNISHFPAVLKPAGGTGGKVYYCNTIEELKSAYRCSEKTEFGYLCQEYISGFGCGYFGLYVDGKKLASFMHKRIKEYPVSGGPSVVAESFYDKRLENYGHKLCEGLKWSGPIMCEFKYDPIRDDYKLIEINPKFWGSLELTLEAGVNMPYLMVQYITNQNPKLIENYENIRYRWILSGELLHYLETRKDTRFSEFRKRQPNEVTDIRLDDPLATLYLSAMCLVKIVITFMRKHSTKER